MRLRHAAFAASILALACATPALAGDGPRVPHHGSDDYHYPDYDGQRYDDQEEYAVARDAWFEDCVRRGGPSGVAGALLGGAVGGVAGNRIAGRGNRTVGTIIGAGVGAVAGAAIERGAARDRVRDECAAYLDSAQADYDANRDAYDYADGPPPLPDHGDGVRIAHHPMPGQWMGGSGLVVAQPAHPMPMPMPRHGRRKAARVLPHLAMPHHPRGYPMPMPGYPMAYGYGAPMMMVPVMIYPAAKPECKEVVTEIVEWVDAPRRRAAPRRVIRDKRVRIAPDKRLRMK